ncbi:hypothetical protein ABW19_dt0209380 [Dactylella cylindrospora]|nr:hypothetical protein ABW19_dt0209380 [Dactylella cylindrospora]
MDINPRITTCTPYTTLQSYLSSSITLSSAITSFTSPISTASTESQISTHLQQSWTSLLNLAAATPYTSENQAKLLTFLLELQSQSTNSSSSSSGEQILYNGKPFTWSSLPDFGLYAREAWNFSPSSNSTPEDQSRWVNLNAFISRLTVWSTKNLNGHGGESTAGDFSLYGIWSLRELEDVTIENVAEVNVKAAAVWVIYAGEVMWRLAKEGREYEGRVARGGARFAEKGWKGYSVERWEVWEGELRGFVNLEGKGEEVRGLVEQALQMMEAVKA